VKRPYLKYSKQQGFTLVELLVVMAVFIVVMMIAGQTFNNIYSLSSKFTKSEESNIEGIVGLELMRHDLEQMGFGLPWGFSGAITYSESDVADALTNDDDKTARTDTTEDRVPRALVGLDGFAFNSSDLLGVKGSTLGRSQVSQRWAYVPFHNYSANPWESRPVIWPSNNLQTNDQVIAIRSNFNNADEDHLLLFSGTTYGFSYKTSGIANAYLPQNDQQMDMIFGIDQGTLRMPFNRSDFFIQSPAVSPACAPNTGLLVKATVLHNPVGVLPAGGYATMGLLDCVADMQVVLGWDTSDKGLANNVDAYSSLPLRSDGTVTASGPTGAAGNIQAWLQSPQGIREHLKVVKVYILAQEGKRDKSYVAPATILVGNDGELSLTRQYALSAAQQNYRWKLYRIIARPKNLVSNQH
jgi:prepilin-type N-terminal cleavage/methylation domain-containing protein